MERWQVKPDTRQRSLLKTIKAMNIIFDGNYLYYKTFSVWSTYYQDKKTTPEENEANLINALRDKEKQQVFIRKLLIDACAAINRFKDVKTVVFVIDSSSWRYRFYDNYKYALTRVRESYYKYFLEMLNNFEKFLRKKGFIVSRVMGAEGDDLLYIWSIYFSQVLDEDTVIVTGDSDIRQIINPKVSLFCNNSKNLRFFCIPERVVEWNEYLDTDVMVEGVVPFEITLYKVIMGDQSDNIPKLKNGFGEVAFKKFIQFITPYSVADDVDVVGLSQWIADRFCKFVKGVNYEEILGRVLLNLKLTWLNLAVYNEHNFLYENGKSLLQNMLDDVNQQKDSYNYSKPFTLEDIYGAIIK